MPYIASHPNSSYARSKSMISLTSMSTIHRRNNNDFLYQISTCPSSLLRIADPSIFLISRLRL
ncbi:hypothetical protein P692DRAFT_20422038 [Suillus brevipes Sb2]|nr:hypothetical protein P692DRAFT_20422038 [Suillus brevipes Sb2]